jgi:hypothetical protein
MYSGRVSDILFYTLFLRHFTTFVDYWLITKIRVWCLLHAQHQPALYLHIVETGEKALVSLK